MSYKGLMTFESKATFHGQFADANKVNHKISLNWSNNNHHYGNDAL